MDHKKEMIEYFKELGARHSLWNVFTDFLELSAISLSNSCDWAYAKEREERYMRTIKKYSKEEAAIFPKILGKLVLALEKEPSDVLGELFMMLELGNKWKGQFFTPMNIARVMAEMTLSDDLEKYIEEKGYITVNEPAVGGGANVIAMALTMKKRKINYQRTMVVTAVDVDIRAVHMAYIQFSLLGIPAVVVYGNTLTMEVDEYWRTPFYIMHGWEWRLKKRDKKEREIRINSKLKSIVNNIKKELGA